MNFYCSVVDDQLRNPRDAPTLGLILCQSKDRIIAEYALWDVHTPIGIAHYEFTREEVEAELSRSKIMGNEASNSIWSTRKSRK